MAFEEEETNGYSNQTARIVGTDNANVRIGWTTASKKIGTLPRGATANVLDISADGEWYNLVIDVDHNPKTGSWVHKDYLRILDGSTYGVVNSGSHIRYMGKIINTTNGVKIRATPSTSAITTTALKLGADLVIYETTIAENMAWGRCDAGWVHLYYVDLIPVTNDVVDVRIVYTDNAVIYTDSVCSDVTDYTYTKMIVVDIYEFIGDMARTDRGWIKVSNLGY